MELTNCLWNHLIQCPGRCYYNTHHIPESWPCYSALMFVLSKWRILGSTFHLIEWFNANCKSTIISFILPFCYHLYQCYLYTWFWSWPDGLKKTVHMVKWFLGLSILNICFIFLKFLVVVWATYLWFTIGLFTGWSSRYCYGMFNFLKFIHLFIAYLLGFIWGIHYFAQFLLLKLFFKLHSCQFCFTPCFDLALNWNFSASSAFWYFILKFLF